MPIYGNPISVSAYAILAAGGGLMLFLIVSSEWRNFGSCDLITFMYIWAVFAGEGLLISASIYSTLGISINWAPVVGVAFLLTVLLRFVAPRKY